VTNFREGGTSMAHKHQNSAEQKAKKQPAKHQEEFSSEIAHKAKPAPGHKEQKKHKKI
jgi:hypothetical protein